MPRPRQNERLTECLEGLPSVAFYALWHGGVDMAWTGWISAGLSATVLVGFHLVRFTYNPILLGINVHQIVIHLLIVILYAGGEQVAARDLAVHAVEAVLISVFVVGCALTAFSPRGFIGAAGMSASSRRIYSALLAAASAGTVLWSVTMDGSLTMTVTIPLMVLFGLREVLVMRWRKSLNGTSGIAIAGALAANADEV